MENSDSLDIAISLNWDLIKVEYEILGLSLVSLSKKYKVDLGVLKVFAKDQKWDKNKADNTTGKEDQLSDIKSGLVTKGILKQKALQASYIELELTLLAKAKEIANNLDSRLGNAPLVLKSLTGSLQTLLAHNSELSGKKEDEKSDASFTINIIKEFKNENHLTV